MPAALHKDFAEAIRKLAAAFLANPGAETLFALLAVVKVACARIRGPRPSHSLTHRIHNYPNIPWPMPRAPSSKPPPNPDVDVTRVRRRLRQGYVRRAARELRATDAVATLDQQALDQLRAKHPPGPPSAFPRRVPGPSSALLKITADDVMRAFKSFSREVSGGPSGWTQPLLRIALGVSEFVDAIRLLTSLLARGEAPGIDHTFNILGAAQLTPLKKPWGGIRPIA
ncbi:hypothetical protein V8E36_007636, partial [Tilletia maclaganii]